MVDLDMETGAAKDSATEVLEVTPLNGKQGDRKVVNVS
jgi:hypothetical protein